MLGARLYNSAPASIRKGEEQMTGKTHMAVSAAAVAVLLAVVETASRTSIGTPHSLPAERGASTPSAHSVYTVAGLLLLGILAGLFPDLDAPDSELRHLPRKAAGHIGRYIRASVHKRSALGALAQGLTSLASLPFTLLLLGTSAALRAFTGHRGFTHTLWGALTFTGFAAAIAMLLTGRVNWSVNIGAVWLLGYASHLAADACTPSGIPLFGSSGGSRRSGRAAVPWSLRDKGTSARNPASQTETGSLPGRARRSRAGAFHLLPERMQIRTGTLADTLLVRWVSWAVFLVAAVTLFMGRG